MFFSILVVLVSLATALPENCTDVYINEFHYDNLWRDSRILDFVEIAGPAGTSLDGYEIMTWNGEYGSRFPLCFLVLCSFDFLCLFSV